MGASVRLSAEDHCSKMPSIPLTILFAVITNYCPPDQSINSVGLAMPSGYFNLNVGSLVTLVCPTSYNYVVGSGSLDVVCLVSTATAGVWSTAAGYCTRTRSTQLQLLTDSSNAAY